MPLPDYQHRIHILQRALVKVWENDSLALNFPGQSIACKIDPLYYLAFQTDFEHTLSQASGILPELIAEALIKTGLLLSNTPQREHIFSLTLFVGEAKQKSQVSFLDAQFIDLALRQFGGVTTLPHVADIRIHEQERSYVEQIFAGRTMLADFAFTDGK